MIMPSYILTDANMDGEAPLEQAHYINAPNYKQTD